MSFSWRVSLFVVVALLLAMTAQFALSFWLFRNALNEDLRKDLERYLLVIEQGLNESDQGLSLSSEALSVISDFSAYANGRARVLDSHNQPILLVGGLFPADTSGWLVLKTPLMKGLQLEAIMNERAHNIALNDYLKVSTVTLLGLLLLLGIAVLALTIRLLRPIRDLQRTVVEVSQSVNLRARVSLGKRDDELSRLAQSYNQMMEKLEGYFERERIFTRYASHELRNPLTTLRLQTDAALTGDLPAHQVLVTSKRELQRLSKILDGLLVLARDQVKLSQSCNLSEIVRESIDRARLEAADLPLSIVFSGMVEASIRGDKALLGRLVDNLLENAIKYSQAGEITVSITQHSQGTQLSVQDEGPGVAKEHLDKLATPFYRANKKLTGSGLGLAVVQHIAQAHDAQVSFGNLEAVGFKVSICFPNYRQGTL